MNILEHYIKNIHSVEPYTAEWTSEFPDREFIKVNMTTNCYGCEQTKDHIFNTAEWANIQEQGYYMG